ncbi:BC1881 family protein [Bacillus thuringiensis]|nr:BC1881 family protein [Bacillus thuringiensis]
MATKDISKELEICEGVKAVYIEPHVKVVVERTAIVLIYQD